jgi:hypothetical protein
VANDSGFNKQFTESFFLASVAFSVGCFHGHEKKEWLPVKFLIHSRRKFEQEDTNKALTLR